MLRSDLINGQKKVMGALVEASVPDAIKNVADAAVKTNSRSPELIESLLKAFYQYDSEARNFNASEKEIVKILGFSPIEDLKWRSTLILTLGGTQPQDASASLLSLIHPIYQKIVYDRDVVKNILALLTRDSDQEASASSRLSPGGSVGEGNYLRLILAETEGHLTPASRISNAIEAISSLYWAFATMRKERNAELAIVSCDSGSNKVFDFEGLGPVVREVKEFLLEIWNRVLYHQSLSLKARVEAVSDALPVLQRIDEMKRTGSIPAETAFLLTRSITTGVSKFVESGSLIPEIEEVSKVDAARLMYVPPLLLSAPSSDSNDQPEGTKPNEKRKKRNATGSRKKPVKPIPNRKSK